MSISQRNTFLHQCSFWHCPLTSVPSCSPDTCAVPYFMLNLLSEKDFFVVSGIFRFSNYPMPCVLLSCCQRPVETPRQSSAGISTCRLIGMPATAALYSAKFIDPLLPTPAAIMTFVAMVLISCSLRELPPMCRSINSMSSIEMEPSPAHAQARGCQGVARTPRWRARQDVMGYATPVHGTEYACTRGVRAAG